MPSTKARLMHSYDKHDGEILVVSAVLGGKNTNIKLLCGCYGCYAMELNWMPS